MGPSSGDSIHSASADVSGDPASPGCLPTMYSSCALSRPRIAASVSSLLATTCSMYRMASLPMLRTRNSFRYSSSICRSLLGTSGTMVMARACTLAAGPRGGMGCGGASAGAL
uniref:Uncharacterized protein n=1 Tax=Zea mays TaxID=4577 RepID=C4J677_MAIZE|nr:unknown [Zea mays]